MKSQVNVRAEEDLIEKIRQIGQKRGWGGQREALENALKLYVNLLEKNTVMMTVSGDVLTLGEVKERLLSGDEFSVHPPMGTLSTEQIEEIGGIVQDHLKENPPESLLSEETEIDIGDVTGAVQAGNPVHAAWGEREVGPFIEHDRMLTFNPTTLTVEH